MADASDTVRIADKTTVTQQLAVDADGKIGVNSATPATVGAGTAAAAGRMTLASDDPAVTALQIIDDWDLNDTCKVDISNTTIDDYEAVAASTTGVLGATGAVGDYLSRILLVPGTTTGAPGTVSIRDGSTATAMNIFVTNVVPNAIPINIEIGAKSVVGAWNVLVGANVSVIAFGKFT